MDLERLARAFEAWETDYRAEPTEFLTADQSAAMGVSELSAARAACLLEILRKLP